MMMMSNAGLHRVHASKPPGDLLQSSLITDSVTTDLDKDARIIESQTLFKNKQNQLTEFWNSQNHGDWVSAIAAFFWKCSPEFPYLIQNTCLHFPKKYTCDEIFPSSLSNEDGKTEAVVENYKTYPR